MRGGTPSIYQKMHGFFASIAELHFTIGNKGGRVHLIPPIIISKNSILIIIKPLHMPLNADFPAPEQENRPRGFID
jgi:hypothetical protein